MLPDTLTRDVIVYITETTDLGTSFLFNFSKGDFVIKNGRLVKVSGIEAIKVWIEKLLRTEKFHFEVYKRTDGVDEYGITIEDLIVGYDYPPDFVESELQRELSEALTKHPQIQSISNFSISKDNPKVTIAFKVNLIDGNSFDQEVNI